LTQFSASLAKQALDAGLKAVSRFAATPGSEQVQQLLRVMELLTPLNRLVELSLVRYTFLAK
jgi:hypothetical protein